MKVIVTVVIPYFNQGEFIHDAVSSALNQTHKHIEIIVVNDGSTDKRSLEILNKLPKNIKIINTKNNGLSAARNIGVKNSRGKYFVPLDADDMLGPKFIEETLAVFNSTRDANLAFVYTDIHFFGEYNYIHGQENLHKYIETYNNHVTVCSLIKKEAWEAISGYNKNMIYGCEDWDFWISLIEKGYTGKVLNKPLFYYRLRKDSMSATTKKNMGYLINQIHNNHKKLYMPKNLSQLRRKELNENKITLLRKVYSKFRNYFLLKQNLPNFYFKKLQSKQDIKFSIVIPSYNHAFHLKKCLSSIKEQIYKNFEIIIIDDNSPDDSAHIIKKFIRDNKKIVVKYVQHDVNANNSRTLNEAISLAKGEYIVFVDCDDELLPYSLNEVSYEIHKSHADYISSQMIDIDEEGNVMVFRQRFETVKDLFRGMFAGHLKVIKRSLFDKLGFFHNDVTGCQDLDFVLRTWIKKAKIKFLTKYLYKYRWSPKTTSVSQFKIQEDKAELVKLRNYYYRDLLMGKLDKNFIPQVFILGDEDKELRDFPFKVYVIRNKNEVKKHKNISNKYIISNITLNEIYDHKDDFIQVFFELTMYKSTLNNVIFERNPNFKQNLKINDYRYWRKIEDKSSLDKVKNLIVCSFF